MGQQAVIVIDVQNGILDIPGMQRPDETHAALDAVVGNIARLVQWARGCEIPVLFVQHDGTPGHRLECGTRGWHIRAEIAPVSGEAIVRKTACDSFFQTSLASELEKKQITELIVAGCMTQYCVDTSVRRAVSLGYDVRLVADAHLTADSGDLTFEQIIAHHNRLLDGFDAGAHVVGVQKLDEIIY